MDQNPSDRRRSAVRLIALTACVAVLAGVFVAAKLLSRGEEGPLNPNDPMSLWSAASPVQKLATAEMIVQELESAGYFNDVAKSKINRAAGRRHRKEEIVIALDDATNINIAAYVSPDQSMLRTIEDYGRKQDWAK